MELNYHLIGKKIKQIRKLKKLSQQQLAELVGVSAVYMCLVETAKRNVSLSVLAKIAHTLEVTVDTLLVGNQLVKNEDYLEDFMLLLKDCTAFEKKFVFDTAQSAKNNFRENLQSFKLKSKLRN